VKKIKILFYFLSICSLSKMAKLKCLSRPNNVIERPDIFDLISTKARLL
jgi:hypothetical protein